MAVNWNEVKAQAEQSKKSFYKSTWQKPELDKKGFFIMLTTEEPKPVYISFEGGKYIEHDAPGKGVSTKQEITIEVESAQEKLRLPKQFFDKMVVDLANYAEENNGETLPDKVRVNVRTVKTTKGDSLTLDYISLQKV